MFPSMRKRDCHPRAALADFGALHSWICWRTAALSSPDLLGSAQARAALPHQSANNRELLPDYLRPHGIGYDHMAALGGMRSCVREVAPTANAFWTNKSFHNYADYARASVSAAGSRICASSARPSAAPSRAPQTDGEERVQLSSSGAISSLSCCGHREKSCIVVYLGALIRASSVSAVRARARSALRIPRRDFPIHGQLWESFGSRLSDARSLSGLVAAQRCRYQFSSFPQEGSQSSNSQPSILDALMPFVAAKQCMGKEHDVEV